MAPEAQAAKQPTPALLFDTLNGYQRTQALKTAIELELFTAISEGKNTPKEIADRCSASARAVRILCDFLTIMGFLAKDNDTYQLTPDSAMFLDKRSPAYMGTVTDFILSPHIMDNFDRLTEAVQKGGCQVDSALEPDHPMWVKFARAMAPMMAMPAKLMAELVDPGKDQKLRVLDLAAGHGLYGIAFAKQNPHAEITKRMPPVRELPVVTAQIPGVPSMWTTALAMTWCC
jgi:hypothetical protein